MSNLNKPFRPHIQEPAEVDQQALKAHFYSANEVSVYTYSFDQDIKIHPNLNPQHVYISQNTMMTLAINNKYAYVKL